MNRTRCKGKLLSTVSSSSSSSGNEKMLDHHKWNNPMIKRHWILSRLITKYANNIQDQSMPGRQMIIIMEEEEDALKVMVCVCVCVCPFSKRIYFFTIFHFNIQHLRKYPIVTFPKICFALRIHVKLTVSY